MSETTSNFWGIGEYPDDSPTSTIVAVQRVSFGASDGCNSRYVPPPQTGAVVVVGSLPRQKLASGKLSRAAVFELNSLPHPT
ncbi:MAG TPA: hypothetical protein V6D03_03160 [Candidatus Caenarcaniphilales bacterium]